MKLDTFRLPSIMYFDRGVVDQYTDRGGRGVSDQGTSSGDCCNVGFGYDEVFFSLLKKKVKNGFS